MFKNIYEWLKSYILYARTDPREFPKISRTLVHSNRTALHAISQIAAFIFLAVFFISLVFDIYGELKLSLAFSVGLVLPLIIFACNYILVPRHPKLQIWLVYLFDCVLFGFGFLMAFVISPDRQTIFLLIVFAVVPMLFTDRPPRILALYGVLEVLYILLTLEYKPERIRNFEIINMLIYSNVGLILGCYTNNMKLSRFIFENRVSEMNSQQQLTKYLKSISNIYITMHHADLDTGMYAEVRSGGYLSGEQDSLEADFAHQMKLEAQRAVDPDFLDGFLKFIDFDSLKERLRGKLTITHEFLSKKDIWCRARFVNVDFEQMDSLPRYVIFAVENINEQKNRERALISKAETDAMTGLYNRSGGVSKIKEMLHRGKCGMLCLFDVDKFKQVNDSFGHQVGDQLIVAIADAMRRNFRDGDVLLRLGGDEYMVFLNKITSEELGNVAISRFFAELGRTKIAGHEDYEISVSLGATFYKGGKLDFEELYRQVDSCTYESKKAEGCSFTFWRD